MTAIIDGDRSLKKQKIDALRTRIAQYDDLYTRAIEALDNFEGDMIGTTAKEQVYKFVEMIKRNANSNRILLSQMESK